MGWGGSSGGGSSGGTGGGGPTETVTVTGTRTSGGGDVGGGSTAYTCSGTAATYVGDHSSSPFPRDPNSLPDGNNPKYPWHPHWDHEYSGGSFSQWSSNESDYLFSADNGKTWHQASPGQNFIDSPNSNSNPSGYVFMQEPSV